MKKFYLCAIEKFGVKAQKNMNEIENTKQNCEKFLHIVDARVYTALVRIAKNFGSLESMKMFEHEDWNKDNRSE